MKSILFIVSSGRSGSTLLDMVIGASSKCFSIGEISHLSEEIKRNSLCGCGEILQNCNFWRRINNRLERQYKKSIYRSPKIFNLNPGNEIKEIDRMNYFFNIIPSLLKLKQIKMDWLRNTEILYKEIFNETHAEIIVDSTKDILRAMLLRTFLRNYKCKFIHLVRDGRAVVNSRQQKSYSVYIQNTNGNYTKRTYPSIYTRPKEAILDWRKYNLKLLLMLKFVFPRNRMFLRFEDFCDSPEKWMRKIASFINIPFEDSMADFRTKQRHSIAGNPTKIGKGGIRKATREWERGLRREDLRMFEKKAGILNRYFRYK